MARPHDSSTRTGPLTGAAGLASGRRAHWSSVDGVPAFLKSGAFFSLPDGQIWIAWNDGRSFRSSGEAQSAGASAALFAPDFFMRDTHPWKAFAFWDLVDGQSLARDLAAAEGERWQPEWREPEFPSFERAFRAVQERIADGRLQKAVPTAFAKAGAGPSFAQLPGVVARALRAGEGVRAFGFWDRGEGIVGATPETLFRQPSPERVETMALAGTRARRGEDGESAALLADGKERAEHQLVIDDVARVLSRRADVRVGATRVASLPTLLHLKTEIEAQAPSALAFETLAEDLHPTPALGVAPREAGIGFLRELDGAEERGRFGAPFGVWAKEPFISDCLVAIRCAQWNQAGAWLGSGCGVVAASRLEREWDELRAKRDAVRKALGA